MIFFTHRHVMDELKPIYYKFIYYGLFSDVFNNFCTFSLNCLGRNRPYIAVYIAVCYYLKKIKISLLNYLFKVINP